MLKQNCTDKGVQVSNDTRSVIDTDTAERGIAGIDYQVIGIAHHYLLARNQNSGGTASSAILLARKYA